MKHAAVVITLTILLGCSDGTTSVPEKPTGPSPPGPGPLAWILGVAIDESGVCIDSATARVVRGQALDQSARQETPCSVWEPYGGFTFTELMPGSPMTIRVTAPGYLPLDKTVTPSLGPVTAIAFKPTKIAP